jgi:hypothetical protein
VAGLSVRRVHFEVTMMTPGDSAEREQIAMEALSAPERFLFGASIKRNVENPKSRFFTWLPRYGARGSAKLVAANLWLLPGVIALVPSVMLKVVSKPNDPLRIISYAFLGISIVCFLLIIVRASAASREGRRFRATQ